MKDLDFDELDRAVASVLSDETPAPESQADSDSAQPTVSETSSPSISAHAVHARIMPGAAPASRSATLTRTPEPSATQSQSVAKRVIPHREGRVMDVVHPGGQAKKQSPSLSPVTPVSESIETFSPETTPPVNPDLENAINELLVSEGHAPVISETDAPVPETSAPKTTPPETKVPETPAPTVEDPVDTIAAALEQPLEADESAAMSPFLPDAKVEKRPLGSAEPTVHISPTPSPETIAAVESDSSMEPHLPPTLDVEETPMPEELQNDLLAIESGAVPAAETPAPETQAPDTPSGPTSIARQYKDTLKKASEEDESGAIFDPGTYQQPIEQPAKKSSAWIWIVAVIVLLVVVVVAAAAWFGGALPVPL